MAMLEDRNGVSYAVRQIEPSDLPLIHELTDAEGWSPTLEDIRSMYQPQPQAFTGAYNQDGRLISCCMGYKWGDELAYLGFYITREDYRGRGIGSALFDRILTSLKDRNIILDAVSSVGLLYERIGFKRSEVQIVKYHGFISKDLINLVKSPLCMMTSSLDEKVFEDVVQYDTHIHYGIERRELLKGWLRAAHAHFIAGYNQEDRLLGYGTIRKTRMYYRLAPLYANTQEVAVTIISSLLAALPDGAKVTCITTSQNSAATCCVLKTLGMDPEQYDHETRMFTKQDLKPAPPQVFAVLNTHNTLM